MAPPTPPGWTRRVLQQRDPEILRRPRHHEEALPGARSDGHQAAQALARLAPMKLKQWSETGGTNLWNTYLQEEQGIYKVFKLNYDEDEVYTRKLNIEFTTMKLNIAMMLIWFSEVTTMKLYNIRCSTIFWWSCNDNRDKKTKELQW